MPQGRDRVSLTTLPLTELLSAGVFVGGGGGESGLLLDRWQRVPGRPARPGRA